MDNKLIIFDTTLRDGEQAPGFSMNIDEKLRMARQLEKLSVDILEAGFPIASEGDFEAVRRVSAGNQVRPSSRAWLARERRTSNAAPRRSKDASKRPASIPFSQPATSI